MSEVVSLAGDAGPRWRARVEPARGLRRWTDRTLAQADVTDPDGKPFFVRVVRNWPFVGSPFGPLSDFLPQQVTLPALVAANAYHRGRTGWTIQIVRPRSAWRAERTIWTRRRRDPADVVDEAVSAAEAIARGAEPWEVRRSFAERVAETMNWN